MNSKFLLEYKLILKILFILLIVSLYFSYNVYEKYKKQKLLNYSMDNQECGCN